MSRRIIVATFSAIFVFLTGSVAAWETKTIENQHFSFFENLWWSLFEHENTSRNASEHYACLTNCFEALKKNKNKTEKLDFQKVVRAYLTHFSFLHPTSIFTLQGT